jgi:hypothetical protein
MSTLQIVDSDLSTVLFDLNSSTGIGNPSSVKTASGLDGALGIGRPDLEVVQFSPTNQPGGLTVFDRDPLVAMSWLQKIQGTSYDTLAAGVGELARLLHLGGVIKWQATGAAEARYIDFEPSPAPALLNGRSSELLNALTYFDTPQGVELMVWRQPYLRTTTLSSATNLITNPTLLIDGGSGRAASFTWVSAANISAESINSDEEAYQFTIAIGAERVFRQPTGAATAAPGDVWTGSFYAKQAGSDANCRALVRIEYLDNTSTLVGTAYSGTTTPLTTSWQRLTVTTSAAPASTDRVRLSLVMTNLTATAFTVYWKNAQLEEAGAASLFRTGSETVDNDPATGFGRVYPVYINGDAPSPLQLKTAVAGSAKLVEVRVAEVGNDGIAGRRAVADYLNDKSYAQCEATAGGWTVTLTGADTTSVADALGSGGNVAQTTYATLATMSKRVRISRTTTLDCLKGGWDVWARVKATAAAKHVMQLRWAPSLADPASYSEAEVILDTTGMTAFQYEMVRLGRIYIPESGATVAGVAFELWARRESGSGSLNWDFIQFLPVNDRLATMSIPGGSSEQWLGKDLLGGGTGSFNPAGLASGTVEGDLYAMDSSPASQACGTPPVAGLDWPDGQNRVTFKIQNSGLVSTVVTCRVRNITDSTDTVTQSITLAVNEVRVLDVQFTAAAAKFYQPQVVWTSGNKMWVHYIQHRFISAVGSGEAIYTDPENFSIARLDSSGNLMHELEGKGAVPMLLSPGLHILAFQFGDSPQALHDNPESILARSSQVSHSHSPRYYG